MRIESHNNFNSIIRSVFLGNSATGDDGGKERQFFLRYTIYLVMIIVICINLKYVAMSCLIFIF